MDEVLLQKYAEEAAKSLLDWFARSARALPWRRSYAPYEVWISEVMLQQTQMERGVEYYERWMQRFPSIASIAEAPEEDVMAAWEGLGYYRRARMLHEAARLVVRRHGGVLPEGEAELSALPGLGRYTVAAIRGIAFNHDVVCIDANVERIFSRMLDMEASVKSAAGAAGIRAAAEVMLPHGKARQYDQALMELGALVCRKVPQCQACPLSSWCLAWQRGTTALRPAGRERKAMVDVVTAHAVFFQKGRTILVRRPQGGLWAGMWEFPGGEVPEHADPLEFLKKYLKDHGISAESIGYLGSVSGNYTNHRLMARFYRMEASDEASPAEIAALWDGEAVAITDSLLDSYAMASHHRKMCRRFFTGKKQGAVRQLLL